MRRHQTKVLIVLITLANFALLFWRTHDISIVSSDETKSVHQSDLTPSANKEQSEQFVEVLADQLGVKTILSYTHFYGNVFDVNKYGRSGYEIKQASNAFYQCNYKCKWSTDKADLAKSDAVLMHLYNNLDNKDFVLKNLPPRDNPEQQWILMAREPQAFYYPEQLKGLKDKFNLTVTFQSDSDVVIPYGGYWPLSKSAQAYWAKLKLDYLSGKDKGVAWVVSNCKTSSRREEYVKELQNYIPVDVYGKCGNLTTNTQSANGFRDKIAKEYKFYIAFENSDCDDYISEKFWNSLHIGIVPIVRGHRANYKKLAPPNSYIHADSFISPKQLAEHLLKISNNASLFNQYHEWRRRFDANYKFFTTNTKWMCDLCERVHTSPPKTVDIYEHFSEDTRCFTYLDQMGRNRTGEHVEDITRS